MHLRSARADDREEIPRHYEGVDLRGGVRAAGWVGGVGGAGGGIALMVVQAGTALELAGAVLAAVGALVVFAVVRCRRYEIVLGDRWLVVGAGPLQHRLPVELMAGAGVRAATSWRRLYADQEVVLGFTTGDEAFAAPSREPEELVGVLGAL